MSNTCNIKLLYVEDDTATQYHMLTILQEYFREVIVANDGKEGLEIFEKTPVDMIMTDINMPRMNGIEMIQKIREINADIHIVVFSAYNDSHYLLDSIKLSVCDYLLKPFNLNELETLISQCKRKEKKKPLIVEEEISKYKKMAYYDQLTGVYNRHKLKEIAKELDKKKVPYGLLFFDIDDFKKVNDTYGHDVGDAVLQSFTTVMQKNTRKEDYFARWGGEEFLLLIEESNLQNIEQQAEKLRNIVELHSFDTVEHITISIGLSCSCHNEEFEQTLKKVDIAVYQAKTSGKNRVVSA